jgi:hypothetical protein
MEKLRLTIVASALAIGSTFASGGMLGLGQAQAAVQGGADAIRSASENGSITEQAQFLWGGRRFCWYDDGWQGPGWYWCGYAYRAGFGWGGPVGWNGWRFDRDRRFDRDDFRHDDFRRDDFRRGEFRDRDHRDHDDRRRY